MLRLVINSASLVKYLPQACMSGALVQRPETLESVFQGESVNYIMPVLVIIYNIKFDLYNTTFSKH